MKYQVLIQETAITDIDEAAKWIAAQSVEASVKWYDCLTEAIMSLAELPHRCPLAPENNDSQFEVRHLLYGA